MTIVDEQGEGTVMTVPRGVELAVTVHANEGDVLTPEREGQRSRVLRFKTDGAMALVGRRGEAEVFSMPMHEGEVQMLLPKSNPPEGPARF
ncbi:MAG: hypothetical protein AAGI71_12935 [Bacteroidota bacterium]